MKVGAGSKAIELQKPISLRDTRSYQEKLASQKKQLRGAAQMYEKQFLNEMVRAMRKTVNTRDGVIKKSYAEKLYESQLDDKYVDSWSKTGGIGLANLIYNQLNERYFSNTVPIAKPKGPMPLNNKSHNVKTFSLENQSQNQIHNQMNNKLENTLGNQKTKSSKTYEIQPTDSSQLQEIKSPWKGKVEKNYKTPEGQSVLEVSHPENKLISKFVFPGEVLGLKSGDLLDAGQKMGNYNPELGTMAWNIQEI